MNYPLHRVDQNAQANQATYQEALDLYKSELEEAYHHNIRYYKRKSSTVNIPESVHIGSNCLFIAKEVSFGAHAHVGRNCLFGQIDKQGAVSIFSQTTIGDNSVIQINAHTDYAYRYPAYSIISEREDDDE